MDSAISECITENIFPPTGYHFSLVKIGSCPVIQPYVLCFVYSIYLNPTSTPIWKLTTETQKKCMKRTDNEKDDTVYRCRVRINQCFK